MFLMNDIASTIERPQSVMERAAVANQVAAGARRCSCAWSVRA